MNVCKRHKDCVVIYEDNCALCVAEDRFYTGSLNRRLSNISDALLKMAKEVEEELVDEVDEAETEGEEPASTVERF